MAQIKKEDEGLTSNFWVGLGLLVALAVITRRLPPGFIRPPSTNERVM